MTLYTDAILPITIRFDSSTAVRFATQQLMASSGYRKVNELWEEPLRQFRLVYKRPIVDGIILTQFYEALGGPADEFLLRDWAFWHTALTEDSRPAGSAGVTFLDAPLINTNTLINQADGSTTTFYTYVTRSAGSASRSFRIRHPIESTVVAAFDGQDCTAQIASVDLATGILTFSSAPPFGGSPNNAVMTWGGQFYRAAHFLDDIEEVLRNFEVNWFGLALQEPKGV